MAIAQAGNNMGQPAAPVPADQVMSPGQQRDLFLQSAIGKAIPMDPITWSAASTVTIKAPQTGLAHKIRLLANLTITGSANGTNVTQRAPYNLLTNIIYNDPSGTTRVNATAYELYLLSTVTRHYGYEQSNGSVGSWSTPAGVAALIFNNPAPTTVAQNITFFVDIPISMSSRDTRGTILLESATTPSFIQVTMNPTPQATAATVESPYWHATATLTITGTITPYYYYWSPVWVDVGGQRTLPIPAADMALIHEVQSVRSGSSLNPGADNPFTLQSGRSYYRVIAQYINNAVFDGTHLTGVKFRYDESTFTLNESLQAYYSRLRWLLDRDLPLGVFYWDMVDRPWDSSHYGSLQTILSLDSTTITAPSYVQYLRDCLYLAPQS